MSSYPLILDCDTGEDDAIAIVLAVLSGLPLRAIITTHGNTTVDNATQNSARILSLLGAGDVSVIRGSSGFLEEHKLEPQDFTVGEDFLGKNGICNVQLPPSKYDNILPAGDHYLQELIRIMDAEGPVDYIITGPCTNFAKLCLHYGSDIGKHIHSLTIMGGAIYERGTRGAGARNTSYERGNNKDTEKESWAEFNFYCDPKAIDITLAAGLRPIVVPWDTCIHFEVPMDFIMKMQSETPGGKFVIELMQAFMNLYGLEHKTHFELCDPLTIMAFMGYGHLRPDAIKIVTDREYFGKSYPDPRGYPIQYYSAEKTEIPVIIDAMMKRLTISVTQ